MLVCAAAAASLLTGCVIIQNGGGEDHHNRCEKCEHQVKKLEKEKGEKEEKNEAKNRETSQAKLMAKANISRQAAQQTALAKVPGGTLKAGELEQENGRLQWSFDIATPDSPDITEVNVDAMTGNVISVDKESPGREAKETQGEKDND